MVSFLTLPSELRLKILRAADLAPQTYVGKDMRLSVKPQNIHYVCKELYQWLRYYMPELLPTILTISGSEELRRPPTTEFVTTHVTVCLDLCPAVLERICDKAGFNVKRAFRREIRENLANKPVLYTQWLACKRMKQVISNFEALADFLKDDQQVRHMHFRWRELGPIKKEGKP